MAIIWSPDRLFIPIHDEFSCRSPKALTAHSSLKAETKPRQSRDKAETKPTRLGFVSPFFPLSVRNQSGYFFKNDSIAHEQARPQGPLS